MAEGTGDQSGDDHGRGVNGESNTLYQIKAPHFTCGIVITNRGRVVEAAPIVRYMRSWDSVRIFSYCKHKGWSIEEVKANN